ncbi:hypothetical protein BB559_000414 [Furculomyces boomerangus]|uniref:Calpain catalytic domain-containing protein n=1 Tax=Furculomyces boomerangus TaxID=61424 RepID=A0A2T9Z5F4_9FUNG|nr:hypothetical protein BB559_000414 [Furculomyces boomerangus]
MEYTLIEVYRKINNEILLAKECEKNGSLIDAMMLYDSISKGFQVAIDKESSTAQKKILALKVKEYRDLCKLFFEKSVSRENHYYINETRNVILNADSLKEKDPQKSLALYIKALDTLDFLILEGKDISQIQIAKKIMKETLSSAEIVKKNIKNIQQQTRDLIPKVSEMNISGPLNKKNVLMKSVPEDNFSNKTQKITKKLSDSEYLVALNTSYVNGVACVPWEDKDSNCYSTESNSYKDDRGKLLLSETQRKSFGSWKRLSKFYKDNFKFKVLKGDNITQDTVTDCSFVASLIVCIEHEIHHNTKLISNLLYPQNSNKEPIFNPSGKYIARLFINGFWRRVDIDDYVPVSQKGKLMCTYSTDDAFIIPLIEKAYLKVMGGYAFPGSNSSVDLHTQVDKEKTWKRIFEGFKKGELLITIATGEIGRNQRESLGLVPLHAYAVLDIVEIMSYRLVKVKNPWSQFSWKGKFSSLDSNVWNTKLSKALSYDPNSAGSRDNGIFWIDYDSIVEYFDGIHLNWNPELFEHKSINYFNWDAPNRITIDQNNISNNPQFRLRMNKGTVSGRVWLLLSKHVMTTETNSDYISLHMYKNEGDFELKRKGDVGTSLGVDETLRNESLSEYLILESGNAFRTGEYINSPHILMQMDLEEGSDISDYMLVVSQRDRDKSLYFSLSVYSTVEFEISSLQGYKYNEIVKSKWDNRLSGGNSLSPDYLNNPQFSLVFPSDTSMGETRFSGHIILETLFDYPVQIRVFRGGYLVTVASSINTVAQSGKYRHKLCSLKLDKLIESNYTILVSTYEPLLFGHFSLTVSMNSPFKLNQLPREGSGMRHKVMSGKWIVGVNSMGNKNNVNYHLNPKYSIKTSYPTYIFARLYVVGLDSNFPSLNLSVFESQKNNSLGTLVATSGPYSNIPQGAVIQKTLLKNGGSEYVIIPSSWEPDFEGEYTIHFYSDYQVEIEQL